MAVSKSEQKRIETITLRQQLELSRRANTELGAIVAKYEIEIYNLRAGLKNASKLEQELRTRLSRMTQQRDDYATQNSKMTCDIQWYSAALHTEQSKSFLARLSAVFTG